jgi:hypothetical protein
MYLMDYAAKKYAQEYGSSKEWMKAFNKPTRFEAAKEYVHKFESDYEEGEFEEYVPKKYRIKHDILKNEKNR